MMKKRNDLNFRKTLPDTSQMALKWDFFPWQLTFSPDLSLLTAVLLVSGMSCSGQKRPVLVTPRLPDFNLLIRHPKRSISRRGLITILRTISYSVSLMKKSTLYSRSNNNVKEQVLFHLLCYFLARSTKRGTHRMTCLFYSLARYSKKDHIIFHLLFCF